MVFPEAMANKLPILAPNMAGFPEIAEDNINGLLFEVNNVDSLAAAIEKLWNDKELSCRLGANGFEKVKEKYSQISYYTQLEKVYKGLATN